MHWVITQRGHIKKREYIPVIRNLLFANSTRQILDPIIEETPKLQYVYKRGAAQATPMTVSDDEMTRFINAVNSDPAPRYYSPEELTADMLGKEILVKGGPLDGYRGRLLKMQGSKKKRLLVEIPVLWLLPSKSPPTLLACCNSNRLPRSPSGPQRPSTCSNNTIQNSDLSKKLNAKK